MNSITIVGKIINEIQPRAFEDGNTVVNVRVSEGSKDKKTGEWVGAVYDVAFWNKYAESFVKYFNKGQFVIVSGSVKKVNTYQANDGSVGTNIVLNVGATWAFVPQPKQDGAEVPDNGTEVDF